jgi:hypothetical protein
MSAGVISPQSRPNCAIPTELSSFEYTSLPNTHDSFRLLRVLPKLTDKSPLQCELFTASISREQLNYVAGSYVWGPPEPKRLIVVNGSPFHIRDNNLWHFLNACRRRYKTRVIWIDSICINQDNVQERSSQVRAMNRIYPGARSVYCWLGQNNWWLYGKLFEPRYLNNLQTMWKKAPPLFQLSMLAQSEYWTRV